ncbi:MAG: hypothetical protein HY362_03665 [Candidatus Aenigmarchaeota archaeon]|nr:hypothetical protein [Candidatus Aenigmarchaeota archaeon]
MVKLNVGNGRPLIELHLLEPPFYRNLCAFVWNPHTNNYIPYRIVPERKWETGNMDYFYLSELDIPGLPVVTGKNLREGFSMLISEERKVRDCGEAHEFSCIGAALFSGNGHTDTDQIAVMAGRKYLHLRGMLLLEEFSDAPEWFVDNRREFVF